MADALQDDTRSDGSTAGPTPARLVCAHPDSVPASEAGAAAAVHRSSLDAHRELPAARRRFVLALEAARHGHGGLAAAFAAADVPGAPPLARRPAWVGGSQADGRLLRTLTGHRDHVTAVATAVVAGRPLAVTGSRDHTVRIWDLTTGRPAHPPLRCGTDGRTSLTGTVGRLATAAVDGRHLALLLHELPGSSDRVLLLDLATGAVTGECVRVAAVAELAGEAVVLTVEDERGLRLWSAATGAELGSSVPAHLLADRHGHPLALRVRTGDTAGVWDLNGMPLPARASGEVADANASALVIDGHLLACAFGASDIDHLADGATAIAVVGGLADACGQFSGSLVQPVPFAEVSGRPVTLLRESDGPLRVWDRVTGSGVGANGWAVTTDELRGQPLRMPAQDAGRNAWDWHPADPAPALATDVLPQATTVLGTAAVEGREVRMVTDGDHTVRLLGDAAGLPFARHDDRVRAAAAAVVRERLRAVTVGLDRTVRIWDTGVGRQVNGPLKGHTGQVWDVATCVVDGRPVAVTAGADHTVRLWDLAEHETPLHTGFPGHQGAVTAAALATGPGRPLVVTTAADRTVHAWDVASGAPVGRAVGTDAVLAAAARTAGGATVVTATPDGTLRRWDLFSGTELGSPAEGHAGRILALATAGTDGRAVAVTGGSDGTVRRWDLATGRQLGEPLAGHTSRVTALATTTVDGRAVAVTGGWDKTVRLWDVATGRPLGEPLTGHTDWITALTTTTLDGQPVAVTSGRDGVRLWNLRERRPLGEPLPCPGGPLRSLAVVVDATGAQLVTTSADEPGAVSARDLATGAEAADPLPFPAPVGALVAAPDGWLVVCYGPEVAALRPR